MAVKERADAIVERLLINPQNRHHGRALSVRHPAIVSISSCNHYPPRIYVLGSDNNIVGRSDPKDPILCLFARTRLARVEGARCKVERHREMRRTKEAKGAPGVRDENNPEENKAVEKR